MIDQFTEDGTGWARFSDDEVMRYRLARKMPGRCAAHLQMLSRIQPAGVFDAAHMGSRVVFLMLNPSTATAFKPDPTITQCMQRAAKLGADLLEVVNLFAFRSPYPADLKRRAAGSRGDDAINNAEILAACTGATMVIAAWGTNGSIGDRDQHVHSLLRAAGIRLHHLGMSEDGHPKHPLARGKHRIPPDLAPVPWLEGR